MRTLHTAGTLALLVAAAALLASAPASIGGCAEPRAPRDRDAAVQETADAGREPAAASACRAGDAARRATLLHLTAAQYRDSVQDLLGLTDDELPELALPPDPAPDGLAVGEQLSDLHVERHLRAAELLAARAVQHLDRLLDCDRIGAGDDDTCAARFIADFAARAYRRPVATAELEQLLALHARVRAEHDFTASLQVVVQAVLSSSSFLYHLTPSTGAPRGYELASRLSFFLWNSGPDAALLEAAGAGRLERAADVATQAQRMLDDPRAQRGLRALYREWLELDGLHTLTKDPHVHPEYDAALARNLRASLERFLDDALAADDAVAALLLGGSDYRNARLAGLYGPAEVTGERLQPVAVDPDQRAGLLTHPALMAMLGKPNQSDPVQRGRFVREVLLCQPLAQPPSELILAAPDPDPTLSTRELFADHSAEPLCAGCHRAIDPIGFGFEHYDGLGRFRTHDNGVAVDAHGELTGTLDADGPFEGAIELSAKLAQSSDVRACIARQLLRRALPGGEAEKACVDQLAHVFAAGDLRALRLAIVQSDAFLAGASASSSAEPPP